jgi:hypothetical protein
VFQNLFQRRHGPLYNYSDLRNIFFDKLKNMVSTKAKVGKCNGT